MSNPAFCGIGQKLQWLQRAAQGHRGGPHNSTEELRNSDKQVMNLSLEIGT